MWGSGSFAEGCNRTLLRVLTFLPEKVLSRQVRVGIVRRGDAVDAPAGATMLLVIYTMIEW